MASVYSSSFISVSTFTGDSALVVPEGVVWVVKDIMVWDDSDLTSAEIAFAGSEDQNFFVFESGTDVSTRLGQWRGRVVLEAGQQLRVYVVSGEWDVTCCGYQLSA